MIDEPTMNVVVDKKRLINDLNHLRPLTEEYSRFLHRDQQEENWGNDALEMIRSHQAELAKARISLRTMDLVSALLKVLLNKLNVENLTLKINPEAERLAARASRGAVTGEGGMDNEAVLELIGKINVLAKNVPLAMQEKIRFLLVGIKNLLNNIVGSNEKGVEDSVTQINLLTSNKESQNLVREIALIARDIYNTLYNLSESIAVDTISESTEGISDAALKLKSVMDKLEMAASHNLDQLEILSGKVREDEEICDRLLDNLRKSQQMLGELKKDHPELDQTLTGMQEALGDQVGAGVMHLRTKIHDDSDAYLSLIANQSFQDLTGQTLKKTIIFIEELEIQLVELLQKYRPVLGVSPVSAPGESETAEEATAKLPQNQDQVDSLLADLGF